MLVSLLVNKKFGFFLFFLWVRLYGVHLIFDVLYRCTQSYSKPFSTAQVHHYGAEVVLEIFILLQLAATFPLTEQQLENVVKLLSGSLATKPLASRAKAGQAVHFKGVVGVKKKREPALHFTLCRQIFTIYTVLRECHDGSLSPGAVVPATHNCFSFSLMLTVAARLPHVLGSGTTYSSIYLSMISCDSAESFLLLSLFLPLR